VRKIGARGDSSSGGGDVSIKWRRPRGKKAEEALGDRNTETDESLRGEKSVRVEEIRR